MCTLHMDTNAQRGRERDRTKSHGCQASKYGLCGADLQLTGSLKVEFPLWKSQFLLLKPVRLDEVSQSKENF